MTTSRLRALPAVEKVLVALGPTDLPRPVVVHAVRTELASLRKEKTAANLDGILSRVNSALADLRASRIQPVINGTGILIHTNFGRAPLGVAVIEKLANIGAHYNNLEYALAGGKRGGRAAYLERNLALLCEAEAATVVNNNAAALLLIIRHFCGVESDLTANTPRRNEVVVSRGELIQIGGGFRIPEILEASGDGSARLAQPTKLRSRIMRVP